MEIEEIHNLTDEELVETTAENFVRGDPLLAKTLMWAVENRDMVRQINDEEMGLMRETEERITEKQEEIISDDLLGEEE